MDTGDESILSQLGGFALSEVFKDLGLDLERDSLSTVQNQLGLQQAGTREGASLSKDLVYNGKFVDDDDDGDDSDEQEDADEDADLRDEDEDEADEGEEEEEEGGDDREDTGEDTGEDERQENRPVAGRQDEFDEYDDDSLDERDDEAPQAPLPSTSTSTAVITTGLVRGEEDDFDEDEDDPAPASQSAAPNEPQVVDSSNDRMIVVKEEPRDDDDERQRSLLLPTTSTSVMPTETEASTLNLHRLSVEPISAPPAIKQADVNDLFPTFEYGRILNFTELFSTRPRKRPRKAVEAAKIVLPAEHEILKAKSTKDALIAPMKPTAETRLKALLRESQPRDREDWEDEGDSEEELMKAIERLNATTRSKWRIPESIRVFDNAELDDWEKKIVWGPTNASQRVGVDPLAPRNMDFDRGDWTRSIIWDASKPYKDFTQLNLNLNDRQMVLEVQAPSTRRAAEIDADDTSKVGIFVEREPGLDPFNISNDREYIVTKEAKQKIRQTFGSLEVQHAHPAAKLQLPFYKTRMSKSDLRSFHRPSLQFPLNVPLSFDKSRSSKKKKDATGKKVKGNELRHMMDITLKDTSSFVLWEYSEENPPIVSNVGMGSIIVNYYRKREPTDTFVPNLDLGEPLILEGTDESPFKAFGYVHPGQTVPTLYNNLIRAPLFRHRPPTTDFLICRVTIEGETKYYIRDIKNMFVIGQTYPMNEVPGPHSRKITTLVKNRLQNITFKLIEKNPHHRIKVNRLTRYFPDQNDLQMRQRLKEFMEFNRKGPNQGFWMIKKTVPVPDDAEMMKAATPEMVCLAESMQVGLRHLQDAGYGAAEEGGAGDDDSKLDIEQQLAPWITTKNFINATANKAMLKLHGDGDPTGRGEAFSFLRTSMKDIFLRAGELMETRLAQMESRPKSAHRYNVQEQQDVYKEEIARIWKAQWDSLRNPIEPELTAADEERARAAAATIAANEKAAKARQQRQGTVDTPGPGTPGSRASSPADSVATGGPQGQQAKTLRIKRFIDGKWETEIVRDPTIISAYVRQRKAIEEEKADADDLLPSDDEGKNERARKRLKEQLEKLKRNQERRLARKNQKLGIPLGAVGAGGLRVTKTETTRVCGNCGQRGHMKTSKKLCPRWHEFNAPKGAEPTSTLSAGFGGGLALPSLGGPSRPVSGGQAGSPPPTTATAPKPTLKFKLSTAASPPPARHEGPASDAPMGDVEQF